MIFKKCFRACLVSMSLLAVAAPSAFAVGVKPSILGGLNQTVTGTGTVGYTAGARLSFGLGVVDADLSAMFLSRGFSGVSNTNWIQIPAMVRYAIIPAFNVGGGFYVDAPITSGASSLYGLRGALQFTPPGLPLYLEGAFNYNLGQGGAGTVNDVQVLAGFSF